MAYVWINPVVASMYEEAALEEFLRRLGHERFEASANWPAIVRGKYEAVVQQAPHTVMDMRCPKIKDLLDEMKVTDDVTIPEIAPILIHCGQEGSARTDLEGEEKIITTPCQALADMGNALELKNTRFVSWNQFVKESGVTLTGKTLKKSPIPPGFFDALGIKTVSVTGEEEIRSHFHNYEPDKVQLVEMLFCKEGCHNGDGIKLCE